MSTATTTSHDTGQTSSRRTTTQPTNTPTTQLERNAANRLRTTIAAVRLAFTWPGGEIQLVACDFEQIRAAVGDLLVDRPRRSILSRGQTGAGV